VLDYTADEMKTAYSYVRFSTPQQALGDSLRRQVAAAEQFCKENGYTLDRSLTLHDKGIRAFRGENIEIGRLGVFLGLVKAGIPYNKNGFAIARGYWEGGNELRLACRWHEDGGIGYPQTFGKPQWMMLPNVSEGLSVEIISTLDPSQAKVVITLT